MKQGGFALKKSKKKALETSAGFSKPISATPQGSTKVFVTDFDPNVLTKDDVKPLVIPLLETNSWNAEPKEEKIGTLAVEMGTLSADQEAAAQIIAESKTHSGGNALQQKLVIPVNSMREKRCSELFQDGVNRSKRDQLKPILQQNAVPGLDELQDVTDKYRHDVALRPDAPDVLSDVYESVPVEAFGAALLRGMGWRGETELDDVGVAPRPRHKLLGLGATKRPGEDKKKRRKRRKTETLDDDDRRSGIPTRDGKQSMDREAGCSSQSRSDRHKRSRSRDVRGRNRHRRSRSHDRSSRRGRRH